MSKIPTTVTYILQEEKDYLKGNGMYGDRHSGLSFKGRKAFVTDSSSEKSIQTGLRWARGWGSSQGYVPDVYTKTNDPITGLKIYDVESRDEGGRAWKVVNPEGLIFDLREDQLLYVVLTYGIGPDGVLPGSFVWGYNHNQIRLLAEGSPLHQKILDTENLKKEKAHKIKAADLIIGGIYNTTNDDIVIYLGRIRHRGKKKFMWTPLMRSWEKRRHSWDPENIPNLYEKSKNYITVTGGVVATTHLTTYTEYGQLPSPEFVRFEDGFGCGICLEELSFE